MTADRSFDVAIVGAGPAGSAAAVSLSRAGYSVCLIDRSTFPRHKLCGEFLSSESIPLLRRLSVLDGISKSGGVSIGRLLLTTASGKKVAVDLPEEALGISRFVLDDALVRCAEDAGATILTRHEVDSIGGCVDDGFVLSARPVDAAATTMDAGIGIAASIVIGAWGRRSKLDRVLRPEVLQTSEWVAFKGHYTGVDIGNHIEMHAFPGGYCGMSHVEGGVLNACWILRTQTLRDAVDVKPGHGLDASAFQGVERAFLPNRALVCRFAEMSPVFDRPLSVSQLRFDALAPCTGEILLVGDAAGMIAPICGDGMSMALMSGIHVARRLGEWFAGATAMPEIRRTYAAAWRQGFRRRMQIGRFAHRLLTSPRLANVATQFARATPSLLNKAITATRGYPDSLR